MSVGVLAQQAPTLGALYEFGAVASSSISSTGKTTVQGKVGVSDGNLTGFLPDEGSEGTAVRGIHKNDDLAKQAVADALDAMAYMASLTATNTISNGNLSGATLNPGVHVINGAASLDDGSILKLNGASQSNPVFIIKVKGDLTIGRVEKYELQSNAVGINLFWLVDGNVVVKSGGAARGNIFAKGKITMEDGARLRGRVISPTQAGSIIFSSNSLNHPTDLAVQLSMLPSVSGDDKYTIGEKLTYNITVRNNGPVNARGVSIPLGQLIGLVKGYTSSMPNKTSYVEKTNSLLVSELKYQEEVTITVEAEANRAGSHSSLVSVSWEDIDEVNSNDDSVVRFCVLLSEIREISGPVEICRGDVLVYSIESVEGATYYEWVASNGLVVRELDTPNASLRIEVTVGDDPNFPDNTGWITVTPGNSCGPGPSRSVNLRLLSGVPSQPRPISGPDAICQGATGVTYSIAPVENASSYTWTLPNGWTFASGGGSTMTGENLTEVVVNPGDNSGTITVIAANACGDSEPQTLYVQVNNAAPEAPSEIIGTLQGCLDTVVPYEVAEVPTATRYNWTVPAGWEIQSGQGTRKVMVRVGSTAGEITVVTENGCGVSEPISKPVEPVTSPSPAPGQIIGDVNTCINQVGLEYSVEPIANATSYEWTVPSGWEIVSGQGTVKIVVNTDANGGEITVVAWNDCGPSDPSTLTVVPTEDVPLQPGPISGMQYGCVGNNATYSIEEVTGTNSYVWTVPAGWTIVSGQGTTSIVVETGTNNGKVTVTAINGCGTGAVSELDVVPQTTPPSPPTPINGPAEVCENGTDYVYSVNPIAGVNSYIWTVPADWTITEGQGTASITVTAGKVGGVVTVKGENDCGTGADASLNVTLLPSIPDQPGAINGLPSACNGQQNIVYSIEPVANASSYIWSVGDNNGWEIVSGQGTTRIVVNAGTASTVITVRAVNACGVTEESELTAMVTSEVPRMPGPIYGSTVPCVGATYTFSIDPVKDAFKYNWSVPSGWRILENNGTSIVVITNGTGGAVRVSAENSCGPGIERSLQVVPSTTAPVAPEAILGNVDVCARGEATFSVKEVDGASGYAWSVPLGWAILSGQGTATVVVQVGTVAGTVTVTTLNECGDGGSISRAILLNTAPPATPGPIAGSPQACTNSTATYSIESVNTASSYVWTVPQGWEILSGQGSTSIEVLVGTTAGNVTVAAANSCGGSGTATLAVEVADNTPVAPGAITAPTGSFCLGTEGLEYSISPVSGAASYAWTVPADWTITSGQGTTRITVTAGTMAGQVTVSTVNACGNGGTASVDVAPQSIPVTPEISIGSVNPCQDVTTTYSVTANTTGNVDSYIWEVPAGWEIVSGHNTNTIEVLVDGTAGTIRVTAVNSCQASGTAELEVVPSPAKPVAPEAIVGETGICAGSTVSYTVQNPSNSASYSWTVPQGWEIVSGQGTATVTVRAGQNAGTISVKGVNGCGTTDPASLDVAVMPAEGATVIRDTSTPCEGLSYEVEPVPGATTYTWAVPAGWSITSGQGTPKITVTAGFGNGDISVVVSNGGCTDEPLYITPQPIRANSELHFPNVFSPNNDGTHDRWEVRNLLNYPDNEVTIINRWGNEVYHSKSYKNDWDGDNLSEGTYFYMVRVKLCDGQDKMFKGYVMIVR
ncbi:hypothetical protein PKOR_05815 [Pontibacter korlensis]|uniref:Uncharacterized protein n=2 Tax=Pontibacter korlensis TaxID=400092 RepID=A0A0E3ZDZ8_9BACT|nr:hypothetical protein PKOR_05815 [Pontibacter korlensis]